MRSPDRPDADGELEVLRTRTIAELEHQLERQRIDHAEFERRMARAVDAGSTLELRPLVADLLAPSPHAPAPPPVPADERSFGAAPATTSPHAMSTHDVPDHDRVIAIMSSSNRSGAWDPPENVTALSLMGGIRLDFREAALLEGVVTKVSVFCLMAGVEIVVPPDIHVSVGGTGLLGGFGHVTRTAPHADAPRLHISGLAVMGGVDVKVRELGEDGHDGDSP